MLYLFKHVGLVVDNDTYQATKLPDGMSETVSGLKQENKTLKHKLKSGSGGGNCGFAEGNKCVKVRWALTFGCQ